MLPGWKKVFLVILKVYMLDLSEKMNAYMYKHSLYVI